VWTAAAPLAFPGITVRKNANWASAWERPGDDVVEIRGVAFENTAATEQWALARMRPLFDRMGNLPLGAWALGEIPGDPAPLVRKYVSVTQTFGDKRLETHLLGGLEIFATGIPAEKAVAAVYTARALRPPGDEPTRRSYYKVGKLRKNHIWDALSAALGTLDPIAPSGLAPGDLIAAGILPTEEVLPALTGEALKLARIYARLGSDAGRALAGVHRSGLLWGTFCDHNL
jgi:hypothetical protein